MFVIEKVYPYFINYPYDNNIYTLGENPIPFNKKGVRTWKL